MGQVNSPSNLKIDKPEIRISFEEFIQIVEAVLEGRYSWACVLFLRFAGFNPLHYIPYRTYNRLVKLKLVNGSVERNSKKTEEFKYNSSDLKYESINQSNEEIVTRIAAKLRNQDKINE